MRFAFKRIAFTMALLVASCSNSLAQESTQNSEHEIFSGAQVREIANAWSAIEREFAPSATLNEFEIRYLRNDRAVTISFFRPNTVIDTPESHMIRQDSLSFRVVIEGANTTVFLTRGQP